MVAIMVAFFYASNHAFIDRPCCCDAQRMAIQTSFAKKVAGSQDCDDCLLALLGNDGELDFALLDVKTASATSPCEKTT
jgi:hypothetical protein